MLQARLVSMSGGFVSSKGPDLVASPSPGADLASAPGDTVQSIAAKIAKASAWSMANSLKRWKWLAKT